MFPENEFFVSVKDANHKSMKNPSCVHCKALDVYGKLVAGFVVDVKMCCGCLTAALRTLKRSGEIWDFGVVSLCIN